MNNADRLIVSMMFKMIMKALVILSRSEKCDEDEKFIADLNKVLKDVEKWHKINGI